MSLFSIWPHLGFYENPYDNRNLPGDEMGDALFVGREREVGQLQRQIASEGTHPSVEGLAGVGKSSMVAVASYRMLLASLDSAGGTLYLPVRRFFQAQASADALEEDVYRELAQTLIENVDAFPRAHLEVPNIGGLDKWLNSPQYRSAGAGVAPLALEYGSSVNEAVGFAESGFPRAVQEELRRCFPGPGAGAVICVLDNLELLQTSAEARAALEALRDRIFNIPGVRWVLCGSRGIVSRARSERLSGIFAPPLILGPVPDGDAMELIDRRISLFRDGRSRTARHGSRVRIPVSRAAREPP